MNLTDTYVRHPLKAQRKSCNNNKDGYGYDFISGRPDAGWDGGESAISISINKSKAPPGNQATTRPGPPRYVPGNQGRAGRRAHSAFTELDRAL